MMREIPSPKLLFTGAAVVVASVAYAVGSQTGGGTAGAATKADPTANYAAISGATGATGPKGRFGRHGRLGGAGLDGVLADAAKALGVTEAKLRTALEELKPTLRDKHGLKDELAASLAKSLGLDQAKVTAALEAQRPERGNRGEPFAALAKALGLSTTQVEQAFKAVRPERRAQGGTQDGRDAFLTALAKELGVTKEKLATALGTTGGPGFGRHGHGGPGPGGPGRGGPLGDTAAVAKALGVDQAKLTAALETFRAGEQQEHEALRADLVKQLAAKLGVPEAKVAAVARQFLPGGPGRRRP